MPLINSHTDEAREKNIKEMIDAGHDPKQAVAAGYAHQRKMKKMAEGGRVEEEKIEDETSDPHRGLFELQESSEPNGEDLSEEPEYDKMVAHALKSEQSLSTGGDVEEEEPTPDDKYAEEARNALQKRKKLKIIA